jgi:hypothetical protein
MSRIRTLLVALCALVAVPATASAAGPRGGDREFRGGGGDVSSTVAKRIRRAERALDRAEERVDDGETAKAIAQLKASRRYLASASKAAERRDDDSLGAVARAQHHAIVTVAGLFDGVTDGDLVSALDATLDVAVAGRSTADAGDVADEREAIADALADDELTDGARASLTDADAALQATPTTVSEDDAGPAGAGERDGRCRDRRDGDDAPSGSGPAEL